MNKILQWFNTKPVIQSKLTKEILSNHRTRKALMEAVLKRQETVKIDGTNYLLKMI